MVCVHLRELYQLCENNELRIGGSDLIRIVCRQCDQEDTCPSMLMDQYDEHMAEKGDAADPSTSAEPPNSGG